MQQFCVELYLLRALHRFTLVRVQIVRVLVGLLMQYSSGGIKPTRIGWQRFALLPSYERGGWRIQ